MKIGINCGHTFSGAGCGTQGFFNESKWSRIIGYRVMANLIREGHEVIDCTIHSAETQYDYLNESVKKANINNVDLFISLHFNASGSHLGNGCEVWNYTGNLDSLSNEILKNICSHGFKNRGTKNGKGLYVIAYTNAPAYLIEICFCDNSKDTELFIKAGAEKIADCISKAIENYRPLFAHFER